MAKIIYGGDAANISQLEYGDCMTTELLNCAIGELLPEAYITKQRITVLMTNTQLMQLQPDYEKLYAMIYFMPIDTYESKRKAQLATISCNDKVIKIYTHKG